MYFSDYSWKYFPDTGRITETYITFIKVVQLTMVHGQLYYLIFETFRSEERRVERLLLEHVCHDKLAHLDKI